MALIRVQNVFHRNSLLLHREGNLVGFGLLHPGVVRSLANQKWRLDVINVVQRRNLLVEFLIAINISDFLQHVVTQRSPVCGNRIEECFDVGWSNDVNSTLVDIGCESQARKASISSIRSTIDTDILGIGNAFINGPLNRVCQIVLHGSNAPFFVSLVKEVLSIPCRTSVIHLQSGISSVGKPLCLGIETPVVACPWSTVDQQNQRCFVFVIRSRQVADEFESISRCHSDVLHWGEFVVKQIGLRNE
mmetsp:Transcript_4065/g.8846  ORF Transcript_4065/g.8846 Transcript_4065/m.8846 type:complete len:247 (-) Transcript_4065:1232-1972(-)